MTHGAMSGPEYLAHVMKNGLEGDGFNLMRVSKLFREGNFKELDKWGERNPFIKDAAEWLRGGGKAAYMQADDVENGGRRLLTAIKTNQLRSAGDAMMMFLHQWNDSWDLLSRVTAYGLVKRDELQRLGYDKVVEEHGADSKQAQAIYTEAMGRAKEKAKGLANFSLYGEKGRKISSIYMFFRPEITTKIATMDALAPMFQSEERWLKNNLHPEELKEPEAVERAQKEFQRRKKLATTTTIGLMGAGAALYATARLMSDNDEQGRNRVAVTPKRDFMKGVKFPIPGTKWDASLNYGFGPGAFAGMGAQIMAALYGDQSVKDAAHNIADLALEMVMPITLSQIDPSRDFVKFVADTLAPSWFKPGLEYAMNTDSYGNPIYNDKDTKYPGAYTGGQGVKSGYKATSEFLYENMGVEIEPNELAHWVSSYAGVVDEYANIAHSLYQALTDKADTNWKLLIGSWIARSHNMDARDYADVAKDVANAKQRLNDFEIHPESAEKIAAKHPDDEGLVGAFESNLADIRALQAEIKMLNFQDIPHKEKQAQLDDLTAQLSMLKRQAVTNAESVKLEASESSKP